jgi:hypothetical protein
MSLFSKLRNGLPQQVQRPGLPSGRGRTSSVTSAVKPDHVQIKPAFVAHPGRLSNGLKEFLWQLDGIGRGQLLDLGTAWHTTITFFLERDFKVYTENLLTSWKEFLDAEEKRTKAMPPDPDRAGMTGEARAERFLDSTLQYPAESFDAVLAWDLLDYLDSELVARLTARLSTLVRDGGVVLAIFHARKPESFHRYRVSDSQHLELIPAQCPFAPQRVYQNREISNLFSMFRSSKIFVGRDQLREGLFVK